MWPFKSKPIIEERRSYTDAIVKAILDTSAGKQGKESPTITASLEVAASMYSRAFTSATVTGTDLVTPDILASIGRDLIRYGQTVFVPYMSTLTPEFTLLRASSWNIIGGYDPASWKYDTTVNSPNGKHFFKRLLNEDVLHFKYATENETPWIGVAPLQWASYTAQLMVIVEKVLRDESSGTRGYLLPVPADGSEDAIDALKTDLGMLRGGTALVETTAAGWGRGPYDAPQHDYTPKRIGPNFPKQVVDLHQNLIDIVLTACGVPLGLIKGSDPSGLREAWRQFLHGSISPVAKAVEYELSKKLDREIRIDFTEIYAADVQSRARAFESLTRGGMEINIAAEETGFNKGGKVLQSNELGTKEERG